MATMRASADELRQLKEVLDEAGAAIRAKDTTTAGRCNQNFHDTITRVAHNDLLASLLEPLEGRLHWLLRQNDDPLPLYEEHVSLYEAIAGGDVEHAAAVSLQHVRTSRDICHRLLYRSDEA